MTDDTTGAPLAVAADHEVEEPAWARPVERRRSGAHRAPRRDGDRPARAPEPAGPPAPAPGPVPRGGAGRPRLGLGRFGVLTADRVATGVAPDVADGPWWVRWYVPQAAAAWLAGRVVVAAALGLVHFLTGSVSDNGGKLPHTGLLGWDAGWYETIALHGYSAAGADSRRFFPLLPMLVHGIGSVTGHQGAIQLVVVNAAAFALLVLLAGLARAEGFSDGAIRRTLWLTALAPPAFVLVMGYSEALAMLCAAGAFLAVRTADGRAGPWWLAALAGFFAGLCRPLGLLLVAPVAIEAVRELRGSDLTGDSGSGLRGNSGSDLTGNSGPGPRSVGPRGWAARVTAVAAPGAGAGAYLLWSAVTYHDGLAPLTMQRSAGRHGATADPLAVLWHSAMGARHGNLGTALHVPWVLLAIVGIVAMARLLPVSYTVWSALVLLAVLTGSNLDSSERYLLGAFPFVMLAALLTARRTVWPFVLAASTAMMTVYATLAFTLSYVP